MFQRVNRTQAVSDDGRTARTVETVDDPVAEKTYHQTVAARIIWYIAGVLLVLLGFRFVLALLGANPDNGFANFIYTVSHPFVAPFFNLFNYTNTLQYHTSRFEIYTLVAMAVYAVIAWGLARLFTLTARPRTV